MQNFQNPTIIIAAVFAAVFTPILAAGQEPAVAEAIHGRVSYSDQGALLKGATDSGWSYGTVNTLVLPGDTLWADDGGVLEVEFPAGTYLRMADGSKAEIQAMTPELHLKGWNGSFYVHRIPGMEGDIVFETPVAKIRVRPFSQVRVDILGDGSTTVTARWGKAQVDTGDGHPVDLNRGMRTYIDPGYRALEI